MRTPAIRAAQKVEPATGSEGVHETIHLETTSARKHSRDVVVELSTELYHKRTLHDIPQTSTRRLRQLVAQSATRFFPLSKSGLVTNARWTKSRDGKPKAVAIAAERDVLAQIAAQVSAAKQDLDDVIPAAPDVRGMSLLPEELKRSRNRRDLVRTVSWLFASLLLSLGAAASQYAAMRAKLRENQERLRALRPVLHQARTLEGESRRAEQEARAEALRAASTMELTKYLERVLAVGASDSVVTTALTYSANRREIEFLAVSAAEVLVRINRLYPAPPWEIKEGPSLAEYEGDQWTRVVLAEKTVSR